MVFLNRDLASPNTKMPYSQHSIVVFNVKSDFHWKVKLQILSDIGLWRSPVYGSEVKGNNLMRFNHVCCILSTTISLICQVGTHQTSFIKLVFSKFTGLEIVDNKLFSSSPIVPTTYFHCNFVSEHIPVCIMEKARLQYRIKWKYTVG